MSRYELKPPQPKPLTPSQIEQAARIEAVLEQCKADGDAKSTIKLTRNLLKALADTADLNNPEQVKMAIANFKKKNKQPANDNYKISLVQCYQRYMEKYEITWTKQCKKPHYVRHDRSIQPPTDERCNMILTAAHSPMNEKLDLSRQTGLRPCELVGQNGLRVRDIHPDTNTVTPVSAKGCNQRPAIKVTPELIAKLQTYIAKNKLKPDEIIFPSDPSNYTDHYCTFKKRLAERTGDPQFKNVRLYDLRHAYITKQLRKCQNAEIVRQRVGHKYLNTTQRYLHLLTDTDGAEWIVESTQDQKRADELLKQDFTYVLTTPDGYMKFRKPK
jgi:integrase